MRHLWSRVTCFGPTPSCPRSLTWSRSIFLWRVLWKNIQTLLISLKVYIIWRLRVLEAQVFFLCCKKASKTSVRLLNNLDQLGMFNIWTCSRITRLNSVPLGTSPIFVLDWCSVLSPNQAGWYLCHLWDLSLGGKRQKCYYTVEYQHIQCQDVPTLSA